jgi:hypothetical protein
MTDNEFRNELTAALVVCDRHRELVAEAEAHVAKAKARLRGTHEYKAVVNAKKGLKRTERKLADARASHDQIEREHLTGSTGLPIFDTRPKAAAKVAEAVAP